MTGVMTVTCSEDSTTAANDGVYCGGNGSGIYNCQDGIQLGLENSSCKASCGKIGDMDGCRTTRGEGDSMCQDGINWGKCVLEKCIAGYILYEGDCIKYGEECEVENGRGVWANSSN